MRKTGFSALLLAAVLISGQSPIALAQNADVEAADLERKAVELYQAGRYSEAVPVVQRLLANREKALGPEHPDVAGWLSNLAGLYWSQSRYAEAEPLYRRSLAIREKALGAEHPDVASSLIGLARVSSALARRDEALSLQQRALAIREKALGPDDPLVAGSLSEIGGIYEDQHRYSEAEPLKERALAILEKSHGPNHPEVATALSNLAGLYWLQGRYERSASLHQRALAISEKALGPEHPDVARSSSNLASVYVSQGRYSEAEPLYRRALAIREKRLGPSSIAGTLGSLAHLYEKLGRYSEAEIAYKRAIALNDQLLGADHPKLAGSLSGLANLYLTQDRFADAEALFRRSLAIREKAAGADTEEVAHSLNGLGMLYQKQDRLSDAEPLFSRAVKIYERTRGPNHPYVADPLNNLAWVYRRQGRYQEAEPLFQRCLTIREDALGKQHPNVAQSLNNLAILYEDEGRLAEAEALYIESLSRYEKALGRDNPDVNAALHHLAGLYRDQGRFAEALPLIKRLMTSTQGPLYGSYAFPVLLGAQAQGLIDANEALARSYWIIQGALSSAAGAAVSKLTARFAAGSGELAALVRRDQDLAGQAETLEQSVIDFLSKPAAARSAAAEEEIRRTIEQVRTEREKIAQTFAQRFPRYSELTRSKRLTVAETQALLAEDEALLVFSFNPTSYAWLITRSASDWKELNITAVELEEHVRALRASLSDPRQRFDPQIAFRIYQKSFGAFAEKIQSKKRLSVVTDGALTSVPPQLLVSHDPGGKGLKELDWLIRSHAITVLPSVASLRVLRVATQSSSARRPMIAFADPVFSRVNRPESQRVAARSITSFYRGAQVDIAALGQHLPQLPATRKEVNEIARELKADSRDMKLGAAATETAVKQTALDQYRIVYFATHGLVAGELEPFAKSQAEPALVLSIPEQPTDLDDGLLTASEVAQLKLDADWVVLSACNTAAEEKPGAEALSGLARAFFYAGARSLLVSHWNVDDEAAARLMIGTLRAISRNLKLSHAEALRHSMLAMLDSATSDVEADPRLWAPFVVVGEPAPKR
jgi:CHAT domain-containing protein/Tfp pilus assembly protein PilF